MSRPYTVSHGVLRAALKEHGTIEGAARAAQSVRNGQTVLSTSTITTAYFCS